MTVSSGAITFSEDFPYHVQIMCDIAHETSAISLDIRVDQQNEHGAATTHAPKQLHAPATERHRGASRLEDRRQLRDVLSERAREPGMEAQSTRARGGAGQVGGEAAGGDKSGYTCERGGAVMKTIQA
jgi:hypothetical protein